MYIYIERERKREKEKTLILHRLRKVHWTFFFWSPFGGDVQAHCEALVGSTWGPAGGPHITEGCTRMRGGSAG